MFFVTSCSYVRVYARVTRRCRGSLWFNLIPLSAWNWSLFSPLISLTRSRSHRAVSSNMYKNIIFLREENIAIQQDWILPAWPHIAFFTAQWQLLQESRAPIGQHFENDFQRLFRQSHSCDRAATKSTSSMFRRRNNNTISIVGCYTTNVISLRARIHFNAVDLSRAK
jgi:hypothetical protein